MGRGREHHLPLRQGRAKSADRPAPREQRAPDQHVGRERGARGKIVPIEEQDFDAAPGRIARDGGARRAGSNDGEIEIGHVVLATPRRISCRWLAGRGNVYSRSLYG
jgi:hypothetical protein